MSLWRFVPGLSRCELITATISPPTRLGETSMAPADTAETVSGSRPTRH
jgi:hypothetical protein